MIDEDVDVFWVAAEEIAITLNPKVIKDKNLRESALSETGCPSPSDIRIAPTGQIYIKGNTALMEDAIKLITRESVEPGLLFRQVTVCVAPPFRSTNSHWRKDPDGQKREACKMDQDVKDLFKTLVRHGKDHGVVVSKSW